MSKAEEIHYKAVIAADNQEPPKDYVISAHADHFNGFIEGFVEGYHQADEDNGLTWKDIVMIDKLLIGLGIMFPCKSTPDYYQEVLERFKDLKERK